jgi:hypothetical protein
MAIKLSRMHLPLWQTWSLREPDLVRSARFVLFVPIVLFCSA